MEPFKELGEGATSQLIQRCLNVLTTVQPGWCTVKTAVLRGKDRAVSQKKRKGQLTSQNFFLAWDCWPLSTQGCFSSNAAKLTSQSLTLLLFLSLLESKGKSADAQHICFPFPEVASLHQLPLQDVAKYVPWFYGLKLHWFLFPTSLSLYTRH